eukprot:1159341-Pelagomonas_calceolata.AAC.3
MGCICERIAHATAAAAVAVKACCCCCAGNGSSYFSDLEGPGLSGVQALIAVPQVVLASAYFALFLPNLLAGPNCCAASGPDRHAANGTALTFHSFCSTCLQEDYSGFSGLKAMVPAQVAMFEDLNQGLLNGDGLAKHGSENKQCSWEWK